MKGTRRLRHLSVTAGYELESVPPRPNAALIRLGRLISGAYVRRVMGIARIDTVGIDEAARLTADRASRVIFAFRHPSRDDPLVVFRSIAALLPRAARHAGTPLHRLTYPVFLYGRGVAVWGGPAVAWLLPRGGAISVYHQQVNRESLNEVFAEVIGGTQPLALAPEAQVTYHNERVAELQRGTAVLAERARESGRAVRIIPMGLTYHYPDGPRRPRLRRTLAVAEKALGLGRLEPSRAGVLTGWEALLSLLLDDYCARHPNLAEQLGVANHLSTGGTVQARLEAVRSLAFAVAERAVDALSRDDPVERIFEIRRRVYGQVFSRPRRKERAHRLPLMTTRRDVWARNGMVASVHLELVDLLAYLDFTYLDGDPDSDRLAEYALSLADACTRAVGRSIGQRPSWRGRTCRVTFAPPLELPPADEPFRTRVATTHKRLLDAMHRLAVPLRETI